MPEKAEVKKWFAGINSMSIIVIAISAIRIVSTTKDWSIRGLIIPPVQYYQHLLQMTSEWLHLSGNLLALLIANVAILLAQYRAVVLMDNKRYFILPFVFFIAQAITLYFDTDGFTSEVKAIAPFTALGVWCVITLLNLAAEYVINPNSSESAKFMRFSITQLFVIVAFGAAYLFFSSYA